MSIPAYRYAIALASVTLLAACGGGGGGGDGDTSALTATGIEFLDGNIRLESFTGLCEIDNVGPLLVGEDEFSAQKFITYWAFVTFDLSALPADADVRSATANIRMASATGNNIFGGGLFGNVVMEHIDIGPFLDESDMLAPPLGGELVGGDASPEFLATSSALGFKQAEIATEVRRDLLAGRTRTTLRIRFQVVEQTDGDLALDLVEFNGFDPDEPGNEATRPFLEIRFRE